MYRLSFFSSEERKHNEITDLETVVAFLVKRVWGRVFPPGMCFYVSYGGT